MEFCKKCHSLMVPVKKGTSARLKCRKCGYTTKMAGSIKIREEIKGRRGVVLLEKDEMPLPVIDKVCSKCANAKAYYWLQQTRSADEPPTQFFRCTKCSRTWREYK
ncbi:MAG: transcription factor S [Candidatus Aenigmarchaeota archaeon]|nr:transcription factor S [Candidatus Aenigmarchaeota archaeon]